MSSVQSIKIYSSIIINRELCVPGLWLLRPAQSKNRIKTLYVMSFVNNLKRLEFNHHEIYTRDENYFKNKILRISIDQTYIILSQWGEKIYLVTCIPN